MRQQVDRERDVDINEGGSDRPPEDFSDSQPPVLPDTPRPISRAESKRLRAKEPFTAQVVREFRFLVTEFHYQEPVVEGSHTASYWSEDSQTKVTISGLSVPWDRSGPEVYIEREIDNRSYSCNLDEIYDVMRISPPQEPHKRGKKRRRASFADPAPLAAALRKAMVLIEGADGDQAFLQVYKRHENWTRGPEITFVKGRPIRPKRHKPLSEDEDGLDPS